MEDMQEVTPALENYLEAIYVLGRVKRPVKVIDIAKHLGVRMPSVTYNVKKLADRRLVEYEKRSHVELTEQGERIAREVLRTHEEFYKFFHDILGVSRGAAERDACRVEHVLSRETVNRLVQFSQWVSSAPEEHSYRPASAETFAPSGAAIRLSEAQTGRPYIIRRIGAQGELRKRLVEMGLTRGERIELVRAAPLGDPIEVRVKGFNLSLRNAEAAQIEVEDMVF